MFFAGVRKLPSDYAAYGEYFSEIKEAFKYAHDTWGTPMPSEINNYDSSDLKGIAKKVKEWKELRKMEASSEKSTLIKEAMSRFEGAIDWIKRTGYTWLNIRKIMAGEQPDIDKYNEFIQRERSLKTSSDKTTIEKLFDCAVEDKNVWTKNLYDAYGLHDPIFHQVWIVYKPEVATEVQQSPEKEVEAKLGTYVFAVGPHAEGARKRVKNVDTPQVGEEVKQEAKTSGTIPAFGVFHRAYNLLTPEVIAGARVACIEKIYKEYPWMREKVGFDPEVDVRVPEDAGNKTHAQLSLSAEGKQKWRQALIDWYKSAVMVVTNSNKKYFFKSSNEATQKMAAKGEQYRMSSFMTAEMAEKLSVSPEKAWTSVITELNNAYVTQYNQAVEEVKADAIEKNDNSLVDQFFSENAAPESININKMKYHAGAVSNNALKYKYSFPIQRNNAREKINLNGADTITLVKTNGLEIGDEVSLFVYDDAKDNYGEVIVDRETGRTNRIPVVADVLGKVVEIDREKNIVRLENPISYSHTSRTTPFAISISKSGPLSKEQKLTREGNIGEWGMPSLKTALDTLQTVMGIGCTVPKYTTDISAEYLQECKRAKENNLPPPEPKEIELVEEKEIKSEDDFYEHLLSDDNEKENTENEFYPTKELAEDKSAPPTQEQDVPLSIDDELGSFEIEEVARPLPPQKKKPQQIYLDMEPIDELDLPDFEPTPSTENIPKQKPSNVKKPVKNTKPQKETPVLGGSDEHVLFSNTIMKLLKLSENFDLNNESEKAEEIHRILRKYF
jgi:hypothetical protein